jgi:D-tyrosyl-tRNA(Tyr) deacylase
VRAVVQRVSSARVTVAGETTGEIGAGLLVLLGVAQGDTESDSAWLAQKIAALRIFEDDAGKMNRSLVDIVAEVADPGRPTALVVSQFTLLASVAKGTRPSFNAAAAPALAIPLYEKFVARLSSALGRPVATGRFGAMMDVALVNAGPVTLVIDSRVRE